MFRALFTAASGMTAQQMNLDNVANNLSNASTAGFGEDGFNSRTFIYRVAGIFHSDARLPFLEERCGRRMKKLNLASRKFMLRHRVLFNARKYRRRRPSHSIRSVISLLRVSSVLALPQAARRPYSNFSLPFPKTFPFPS
jgi:flagellar basal body rod protein FlgC